MELLPPGILHLHGTNVSIGVMRVEIDDINIFDLEYV